MSEDRESHADDVPEAIPNRSLPCPVCGSAMRVETRETISVDVCDQHGMWLDHGELESILVRLRSRIGRRHRKQVDSARRSGKMSGALFGWWSLMID